MLKQEPRPAPTRSGMANSDAREGGVYAWMASVRASMTNDPCRQLFEDQVQTHAFIFLDDYLEHILAGPKQGPIIDLVKTPGRKKHIPRRTRAATTATSAKVKSASLFSLDGDNPTEGVVPVNSFHKALLEAKETSTRNTRDLQVPLSVPSSMSTSSAERPHGRSNAIQIACVPAVSTVPGSQTVFPAPERGTKLSVIAEGDEPTERSHANFQPLLAVASQQEFAEALARSRCEEDCPSTEENLEVAGTDRKSTGDPPAGKHHITSLSVNDHHPIPIKPRQVQLLVTDTDSNTEPLPSSTTINSLGTVERNAFTAPLPVVPVANPILGPHTTYVPLNDLPSRKLAHKSSITGFPVLPAPSPLRKSVRVVQDALIGPAPPTAAPAPTLLSKRTSWLMKAREAKAMDGIPGASLAAMPSVVPLMAIPVKRKSGEMLGALPSTSNWDQDQRKVKIAKSAEVAISKETETGDHCNLTSIQSEPTAPRATAAATPLDRLELHETDADGQSVHMHSVEEGVIDLFKRTVEGLGARAGKSISKSLGGFAVAALAEARAAAEARVAERDKINGESSDSEVSRHNVPLGPKAGSQSKASPEAKEIERRLSLSDLGLNAVQASGSEPPTMGFQSMDIDTQFVGCDESVSTTPPDSPPPRGFVKPAGPVFNKPPPPPVFMPPVSKNSSTHSGHATLSAALTLGIPARLASPSNTFPLIVQGTTQSSSHSKNVSDSVFSKRNGIPAPYNFDSQPENGRDVAPLVVDDDDDDSWPLEQKLAAAEPEWRPFDFSNVDKEDTWSSLPTESQGPTRRLTPEDTDDALPPSDDANVEVEINIEEVGEEQERMDISDTEHSEMEVGELEDVAKAGRAQLGEAKPPGRALSQTSVACTASSSQPGLLGQAAKLVNNMLGGGKKAKPGLQGWQPTATAGKKQKEELGKKTERLKETEPRHQNAITKKGDEESVRPLEEEKKGKEELEKRKREREENTDRRPLKSTISAMKAEDDTVKKRKLVPEPEKKSESKKPLPKDKKETVPPPRVGATPASKLAAQRSTKATGTALVSSTAYNATQNTHPTSTKSAIPEAKPFKVVPSSLKGKAKAKPQEDAGDKLPSTMVQSQMAARAKAQMQAAKTLTPEDPSESIELPDINSEYSDSEDEDRVRTFDPPDWAQSPELRQALEMQSTVNPDDIFGAIRPLRMDEMFRTRQSRFRARTSSANWTGTDKLTVEEIREYERRMGFQPSQAS